MNDLQHNEIERKYLLIGNLNLKNYKCNNIVQYYFRLSNLKNYLDCLSLKIDYDDYQEMRVRVIDDKNAVLTLKSKGDLVRKEFETQVSMQFLKDIQHKSIGKICKTRYHIYKDENFDVTIDKYADKNILEVEYTESHTNMLEALINNILIKIGKNIKAEDVTFNPEYKNFELATKNSFQI